MPINRRVFLGSALAICLPLAARAASNDGIVAFARQTLKDHAAQASSRDIVAVADFAAPSWRRRFHLVDMARAEVVSYRVAHGRGSDPGHTGWLKSFSNAIGSNATSRGVYRTGGTYDGKYGRAMRLEGLDAENSKAVTRAIVMHSAWYAADDMVTKYGKLGRSEGCFALSKDNLAVVLERLGPGRLLVAGKL